jgi:hypothetical protein
VYFLESPILLETQFKLSQLAYGNLNEFVDKSFKTAECKFGLVVEISSEDFMHQTNFTFTKIMRSVLCGLLFFKTLLRRLQRET